MQCIILLGMMNVAEFLAAIVPYPGGQKLIVGRCGVGQQT